MLRVGQDTLDIRITGRIAEWVALFWRRLTVPDVPLLPEWDWQELEPTVARYIARKRRRCTLNGHIWEFTGLDPKRNEYTIKCFRCFPHIDSRRVVVSYNPFSTVQRKTD